MARRMKNTSTPDDDTLLQDLAADQIFRMIRRVEQAGRDEGSSANGEGSVLRPHTGELPAGTGWGAGGTERRPISIPLTTSTAGQKDKSTPAAGTDESDTDESAADSVATETTTSPMRPVIARQKATISIPVPQHPPNQSRGILMQLFIVAICLAAVAMLVYLFFPGLFRFG